jgi:formylglycine-generating enzyme required for sulfatase activity
MDELLHRRRIGRTFAVATKVVTVEQFRKFLKANPEVRHGYPREVGPDPDCPILAVNWYIAAQYCRWLSEPEGVPEAQICYPPVADIEKSKDGKAPLRLPADYLSRPVGQKMPNDLGLFDMQGNVWQWCQSEYRDYPTNTGARPAEDSEDSPDILDITSRVLRGGTFFLHASSLRSAFRRYDRPTYNFMTFSFRVARTCATFRRKSCGKEWHVRTNGRLPERKPEE